MAVMRRYEDALFYRGVDAYAFSLLCFLTRESAYQILLSVAFARLDVEVDLIIVIAWKVCGLIRKLISEFGNDS